MKPKLIRITTVPLSLDKLLAGQLAFMNSYYEVIGVSSEKEYLEKIGEREKVVTFHLEMTRQITPLKDLIAVVRLYFFLKKTQPLIVHTHTPKAGTVGMLAAKMAGVPNRLHTIAGLPLLEASGFKRKVLNFVEKITYACATKIYPNSFGLQQIIIEEDFCKPEKLKVIGNGSSNGIDTTFFDPELIQNQQKLNLKQSLNIKEDDFVFIFVGRLVTDKGITELVKAFESINRENNQTKLLLVGPLESDLDPLCIETENSIRNNNSIISVGYQNDVRPYFGISDVLVFPSYREGFPNVVMQAGAMELPSIVSNINGCNEIISEGKNGLIVPVKNTEELGKAMLKILKDSDFREELQSNSRSMILANYEQKVVWDAILKEYKSF